MRGLVYALGLTVLIWSACKKNDELNPYPYVPSTGSRDELTLDSIFLYAYETYLWNVSLPSYETFQPRRYATSFSSPTSFKEALYDLTQVAINPQTGVSYEKSSYVGASKYSFLQDGAREPSGAASIAALSLNGTGNDLGLVLGEVDGAIYIKMVYPGSPAAEAGLTRGMKVQTLNGNSATAVDVLHWPALELNIEKQDGTFTAFSLKQKAYISSLLLACKLLEVGAERIGYLAINQFTPLKQAQQVLNEAFNLFADAQISKLIMDLRYNGGGYVETAEYAANLMISSNLNGRLMYQEHFNNRLQEGKATLLKNQPYYDAAGNLVFINGRMATYQDVDFSVEGNTFLFSKKGGLETLKEVCFIVSEHTASASELLINSLKPYQIVTLVGKPTYGKPVGFFGIRIDNYTLYSTNFQIKNASGSGDYFAGMLPDVLADDDITYDFGDPYEQCTAKAIELLLLANKRSVSIRPSTMRTPDRAIFVKPDVSLGTFNGMIDNRLKIKVK